MTTLLKDLPAANGAAAADLRARLFVLEKAVGELPPVETPITHYFSEGVYAREMFIPKDTYVVGKIHKYKNLLIMSKGRALIVSDVAEAREVEAPFTIVSEPGTKRAVLALEDCVFTAVHGTFETDLGKIEKHFIAQNEQEYIEFHKALMIEGETL